MILANLIGSEFVKKPDVRDLAGVRGTFESTVLYSHDHNVTSMTSGPKQQGGCELVTSLQFGQCVGCGVVLDVFETHTHFQ